MDNTFKDLISGRGFERSLNHYFLNLPDEGVDYRHVYSQADENPFLRIDLDNHRVMSRITQWQSGHCIIETVSFKNSAWLNKDELKFSSMAEFETRLLELIEEMKASRHPH